MNLYTKFLNSLPVRVSAFFNTYSQLIDKAVDDIMSPEIDESHQMTPFPRSHGVTSDPTPKLQTMRLQTSNATKSLPTIIFTFHSFASVKPPFSVLQYHRPVYHHHHHLHPRLSQPNLSPIAVSQSIYPPFPSPYFSSSRPPLPLPPP